jgi:hypothetical protein
MGKAGLSSSMELRKNSQTRSDIPGPITGWNGHIDCVTDCVAMYSVVKRRFHVYVSDDAISDFNIFTDSNLGLR